MRANLEITQQIWKHALTKDERKNGNMTANLETTQQIHKHDRKLCRITANLEIYQKFWKCYSKFIKKKKKKQRTISEKNSKFGNKTANI